MNSDIKSMAVIVHNFDNSYVALSHPVIHEPHGMTIGAGTILSHKDETEIVRLFSRSDYNTMGFNHVDVLSANQTNLIWWQPAGPQQICMPDGVVTVQIPAVVFWIHHGNLSVFALKSNARPTPDTPLYHTGFPNVGAYGAWCTGGNTIPERPMATQAHTVANMFFLSPFTHDGQSPIKKCKDLMSFWSDPRRERSFPVNRLVKINKTIGAIIHDENTRK